MSVTEIQTDAELQQCHAAGSGFVYNDFARKGAMGKEWNVLHKASCHWIRTAKANPNAPKYFSASLDEAVSWLNRERGPEGLSWKRCGTCRPGTRTSVSPTHVLPPVTPARLLVEAEELARRGEFDAAAAKVGGAVAQVLNGQGPAAGKQAARAMGLDGEPGRVRLRDLHSAIRGASGSVAIEAIRSLAEVTAAQDPLNAEALVDVVNADVERERPDTTAERLDEVTAALDDSRTEAVPTRPHSDVLAALSEPLFAAAEFLLAYPAAKTSTDAITEHVALAMRASLARGDTDRAAQLLHQATDRRPDELTAPNLIALADVLYAHPATLAPGVRGELVRSYRKAANVLVERLPHTDELLLGVVVQTMQELDPRQAGELRARWRLRQLPLPEGVKKPGGVPVERPLQGRRIVLAGGDAPTRSRAAKRLVGYGAARVTEVPPAYEVNLSQDQVQERMKGMQVVVVNWRQTKHQTTDAISAALERLRPKPDRLYAPGTGFSSVLTTVLEWAKAPATAVA